MQEEKTFEGQRPDEEVIFISKRHPWVMAQAGFLCLVLIIVLVIGFLFFGFSKTTSILLISLVIFFLIFGSYQWFLYNNYIYILTNQRIILIEQAGLFTRKITEAELSKIQNVTIEIKGPVKTFLNFGDITLRTAGVDPIMILSNVENPYKIEQEIIKHAQKISLDKSPKNIIR